MATGGRRGASSLGRNFEDARLPNEPRVGARLLGFAEEWHKVTTDSFVRAVVRDGYRVELDALPPLSPVPIPMRLSRDSEKAQCLRNEITSLLNKGAVEELDTATLSPGFYSRIFLVPKKDGTFRPVFDLKSLNVYVRKEKFKMTTPRAVTHALHKGDWVVSVDLKDAYFHVPIHRKSRRLLRFAVEGSDGVRAFQFRALPFGLTSAPRVFTKVILPIGHLAHVHAVCLLQYLDDWIVRNTDKSLLQQQAKWLLGVLRHVGLVLNAQKSQLVPTQRLIHIGVEYHLDVGLIFPPMDRVLRIEQKVSFLLSVQVTTAYFWLSLLGIMSSATDAITLGRLHLRPLQFYLLAHWKPASRILSSLVPVKHDVIDHHLRWWLDRECTRAGMILDIPEAQVTLFTDASGSGWGAHVNQFQASGVWSPREAILHINALEVLAVRNSLTAFRTQLAGLTVQLMSDNASVVSYLSKQGGTVSMNLYSLAREVLLLARDLHIFLLVKHIPGDRNALADLLSRKDKVIHTEWTLVQSVVDTIFNIWDKPNVDLFATRLNNRLPVFVSPMADPLAVDVDAMSITWRGMYAYVFPPFVMLGRVIDKILHDHPCELILIAPKWPNQSWYARILELVIDFPLALPLRKDLLSQPHNHQRHQSLQAVCLHAWRLSSDLCKRKDFLERQPNRSLADTDNPHELSMIASGGSSLVGVMTDRWIHSRSLSTN